MPTHPVETDPRPQQAEPAAPNPSHLPVEPEFAPALPPSQAEDPHPQPPPI